MAKRGLEVIWWSPRNTLNEPVPRVPFRYREMDHSQDEDLYLFNGAFNPGATPLNAQLFDDLIPASPATQFATNNDAGYLDPSSLNNTQDSSLKTDNSLRAPHFPQQYRSGSATSSSQGSSSNSPQLHHRNMSMDSNNADNILNKAATDWSSSTQGVSLPSGRDISSDPNVPRFDQTFSVNPDFEASNRQMASDFDFDTAASTPSGLDTTRPNLVIPMNGQTVRSTHNFGSFSAMKINPQVSQ